MRDNSFNFRCDSKFLDQVRSLCNFFGCSQADLMEHLVSSVFNAYVYLSSERDNGTAFFDSEINFAAVSIPFSSDFYQSFMNSCDSLSDMVYGKF